MVVVRCLILCFKFAKNSLSAGLCPDPLGAYSALRDPLAGSWGKGREEKGKMEGQEGREWKGEEGVGEMKGEGSGREGGGVLPSQ